VVVDWMLDVCEVAGKEIRSFPPLVEPFAMEQGLWGVIFPGGRIAFLIDFLLLERGKRSLGGGEPSRSRLFAAGREAVSAGS